MEDLLGLNSEIEITMDDIVGSFKNFSDCKRAKDIKDHFIAKHSGDSIFASLELSEEVNKQVTQLLQKDKKQGDDSLLVYSNGKYKKRKRKSIPQAVPVGDSRYVGTAGECATLAELMFHGYNANRMMIDDGIDIIASKNNLFYYIQVKTCSMDDEGRLMAKIPIERFGYHMDSQVIYIVVSRIRGSKGNENLFFVFNQKDILRLKQEGAVKEGVDSYILKIKYNRDSGKPIAYDGVNEVNITFHMNNFDL